MPHKYGKVILHAIILKKLLELKAICFNLYLNSFRLCHRSQLITNRIDVSSLLGSGRQIYHLNLSYGKIGIILTFKVAVNGFQHLYFDRSIIPLFISWYNDQRNS